MKRAAVVNHGPGWRTTAGALAAEMVREASEAIAGAYRVATGDDVLLVGPADKVAIVAGSAVPYVRHGAHGAVAIPLCAALRAFAGDVAYCARVREIHEARDGGRAAMLLAPSGLAVTRILLEDLEGVSGPIAGEGDA